MGCRFSSYTSPSTFNKVRVVHLNGYVEEFDPPVTVSQVTGKPPTHFVCTPAQLLSLASKPLKADVQLEAGHVHLLLPLSMFYSEVSPLDLATVVSRLTAIARTARCEAKSPGTCFSVRSPMRTPSSPAICRSRSGQDMIRLEEMEVGMVAYGGKGSSRSRSWKPILATIKEKSFNRRSESDLQKEHPEMGK